MRSIDKNKSECDRLCGRPFGRLRSSSIVIIKWINVNEQLYMVLILHYMRSVDRLSGPALIKSTNPAVLWPTRYFTTTIDRRLPTVVLVKTRCDGRMFAKLVGQVELQPNFNTRFPFCQRFVTVFKECPRSIKVTDVSWKYYAAYQ